MLQRLGQVFYLSRYTLEQIFLLWHQTRFTWLQVHEEHNVEPLPHSPEELYDTRGVESAPRAHLLAAEVTQRDLRSEDNNVPKFGWSASGFFKNDSAYLGSPSWQHTENQSSCPERRTRHRMNRSGCGAGCSSPLPPCTQSSWAGVALGCRGMKSSTRNRLRKGRAAASHSSEQQSAKSYFNN